MLENITYNRTVLLTIAVVIYLLISQDIIPKFKGRRRISSGIIGAVLLQAALVTFAPTLNIPVPTVPEFKLFLFASIAGAIIREGVEDIVK